MASGLFKGVALVSMAGLAGGASLLGFGVFRSQMAAEVYRGRLERLAADHAALTERFNDAVRRTAVTELVVPEDGKPVRVRVRTVLGELREIETPVDPSGEVYVDYVVLDGRIWIRRVFDEWTRPADATVIDPSIAWIDWDAGRAQHGKAVYRRLEPGRWAVTVTGSGSLGLERVGDERAPADVELAPPPEIRDFSEVTLEADREASAIGVGDVLRRAAGLDG